MVTAAYNAFMAQYHFYCIPCKILLLATTFTSKELANVPKKQHGVGWPIYIAFTQCRPTFGYYYRVAIGADKQGKSVTALRMVIENGEGMLLKLWATFFISLFYQSE